ncbi:uncharacterized protein TNCV_3320661 [Trichonephila clavipes]|nr:uncharacterized protein TNCV_3320661 [Trichonephila clavipes]
MASSAKEQKVQDKGFKSSRTEPITLKIFSFLKRFKEGRESVEDDKRSLRPQTSHTAENIEKVSAAVRKNMLQTIAESVGISSASCQWIMTMDLNTHRVCQHIVSCMLNNDQTADEVKSTSQAELKDMAKNGF